MSPVNLKKWQYIKILTVLVCSGLTFPHASFADNAGGRVVGVADGDTIVVSQPDGTMNKIHLYGIDAPEKGQDFGNTAGEFLSIMIAGKNVAFRVVDKDLYGNPIAYVYLNGISINAAMVKAGYAWVNTKSCKDRVCDKWERYQIVARRNKKGLWKRPAIPPWEWSKVNQTVKQKLQAIEDTKEYRSSEAQTRPNDNGFRELGENITVEQKVKVRNDSNTYSSSVNQTGLNGSGGIYVVEIKSHVRHYRHGDSTTAKAYHKRSRANNHSIRSKTGRKISHPIFHEKRNQRREFQRNNRSE